MIEFAKLKAEALAHPKKRSRVILEPGFDMVICLHRDSYVQMHRHPRYEAYHVISGTLQVSTEDSIFYYDASHPLVQIPPLTWHEPKAISEFVFYREFYCGPFEKGRDVEYAAFARKEAA